MKKNIDILLALVAWAIGLFTFITEFFFSWKYGLEWEDWIAPLLWTVCVIVMVIVKKRSLKKLWWVWLSFPLAFIFWIGGALMFLAWSIGGFAP